MDKRPHSSPPPKKGSTTLRYIGGVVLLAILFTIGLVPKLRADSQLDAEAHTADLTNPEVETASPRISADDKLLLAGNIEAIEETAVQARTSGYVQKLYVDIGSHVKAGQLLAVIQSPDADQQFAAANSDALKSQATVGQSLADVAHAQAGVVQGRADLERQAANVSTAQASVAASQFQLAGAQAAESGAEARLAQSRQGVETQEASVQQAQANYDLAVATEKRYAGLLKEGFVSQQDYDQAAATLKTSAATLRAGQSAVHAAQSDVAASEQAVETAKAAVRSARSNVDAAKENVKAGQATYRSQQATIDADKATVNATKSTVEANRAAYSSSLANARRYGILSGFERVVAPFEGEITSRNVDVGSLVSPGQINSSSASSTPTVGLFGIARSDKLRIFVDLPQADYQNVKTGANAKILVREIPNHPFEGTVFQSAGAIDASSRTRRTEVRLINTGNLLLPGMYAQVQIDTNAPKSLRIPSNTLIVDASGTRVATIDPQNHIHYRTVTLGKDFGTEIEVISGVSPGDRLVANPSDELKDGETVQVVKSPGNSTAADPQQKAAKS